MTEIWIKSHILFQPSIKKDYIYVVRSLNFLSQEQNFILNEMKSNLVSQSYIHESILEWDSFETACNFSTGGDRINHSFALELKLQRMNETSKKKRRNRWMDGLTGRGEFESLDPGQRGSSAGARQGWHDALPIQQRVRTRQAG